MRREDRANRDAEAMDRFILSCDTCRLGFQSPEGVYIVPMSFGYRREGDRRAFFFHGAIKGRKMQLLKTGQPVGFELDRNLGLIEGPEACAFSTRYQSVIGTGEARVLESPEDKAEALNHLMLHLTGRGDWDFPTAVLARTAVFRLDVKSISFKANTGEEP